MRPGAACHQTFAGAALLAALAGCSVPSAPPPPPPPVISAAPAPKPARAPAPSVASLELVDRYARVEADLVSRGLLRTDRGGPDAPYDSRVLAENFGRIAMFDEFTPLSGQLVARETSSPLRRWEVPVRVNIVFGDSVPASQRTSDANAVKALTARLAEASGHDISFTTGKGANFTVMVLDEDERRALGPELQAQVPGISPDVLEAVVNMPPETFCLVIAVSSDASPHVYRQAISVIRGEHPPLLRQSCFDEEIAQGLGLANDSPEARPSIFNDDEEFALMTTQDALMLKILYDRRLKPGMTSATAMPVVRQIASELLPDASYGEDGTEITLDGKDS